MKFLLLTLAIALIVAIVESEDDSSSEDKPSSSYEEYQKKYGKKWVGASAQKAKQNFIKNSRRIKEHNQNTSASYKQGENDMTDMSNDEVVKQRCGVNGTEVKEQKEKENQNGNLTVSGPDGKQKSVKREWVGFNKKAKRVGAAGAKLVDLRKQMPPIKQQGSCGSCYTFHVANIIEQFRYKKGQKVPMSEQQILDCAPNTSGCNGGNPVYAMDHIYKNGHVNASSYKYQMKKTTCRLNKIKKQNFFKVPYWIYTFEGDEDLLKYVLEYLEVSVAVAIHTTDNFNYYRSGIFDDNTCSDQIDRMTHAINVVGYGTDKKTKKDYWIIRNSWGTSWGEKGYMRMIRGKNNCGVANLQVFLYE